MKRYKIYKGPFRAKEAVKQGWSWPAFLFTSIWALVKHLWVIGFCVIAASVALALAPEFLQMGGTEVDRLINIVGLIVAFVFGANGNSWREDNLLSRGFKYVGMVEAANVDEALSARIDDAAEPSQAVQSPAGVEPAIKDMGFTSGATTAPPNAGNRPTPNATERAAIPGETSAQ